MKTILLTLMLALTACGTHERDQDDSITNQGRRIADLERRIANAERTLGYNVLLTVSLASQIQALQVLMAEEDVNLQSQIGQLSDRIDVLQGAANAQQITLTALQLNENIVEMHDFCGPKAGFYNEIGMKTSTGKYVVYFEQGGSRFLSVLIDGNFSTTDGTGCSFTVSGGGTIINNEHY